MQSGDRRRNRILALALIAALFLVACGDRSGGGYGNRGGTETAGDTARVEAPPPNAEEGTTFVSLASVAGLGLVLVDSGGRTLYAFDADRGGTPACYGPCAERWPPLISNGEPHPSNGAAAERLGTVERRDGSSQVTYAAQPLYAFAGDQGPGEASGDGTTAFGGTWSALKASGQPAG